MLKTALPSVLSFAQVIAAAEISVRDSESLARAMRDAKPGTVIRIAPGKYAGGISLSGVSGTAGAPIVIAGTPSQKPTFEGGDSGLHLSGCSYVELRDLSFTGARGNGINIDDGGQIGKPVKGIVLRGIEVRNVGPRGNSDGVKLSGVDAFTVAGCKVENWGDGGSGIDMVGCHDGTIESSTFTHSEKAVMANGVQTKGGSRNVTVRRCTFTNAGGRALNLGGSTGTPYFRPQNPGYEAREITVEDCHITGSMAAIAFVGVDGANVRFNTIVNPGRWVVRILQENQGPGFAPCRNGVFSQNSVVFKSSLAMAVNIGGGTDAKSFRFEKNAWLCEDVPAETQSKLRLPADEKDGIYGKPLANDTGVRAAK